MAYAFNNNQRFRELFLVRICDKRPDDYNDCRAHSRVSVGGKEIPIVLACAGHTEADLVIIENTFRTDEGEDQTAHYASPDSIESLHRRLCPECSSVRPSFVYLTLFPHRKPRSPAFSWRPYSLLMEPFSDYANPTSLADVLIRDWLALLGRFYEKQNVRPDDNVIERLRYRYRVDGGHLYFREALSRINLPPRLSVDWDFLYRRAESIIMSGTIISKTYRYPPGTVKLDGGRNILDQDRRFYTGLTPHYDVRSHTLALYLYYKNKPYGREPPARSRVLTAQDDDWVVRRMKFFDRLRDRAPRGWILGSGNNQIARANIDLHGRTFGDVKVKTEAMLRKMMARIDEYLQQYGWRSPGTDQ